MEEKTMNDAPIWMGAEEASGWAQGYNKAIQDVRDWQLDMEVEYSQQRKRDKIEFEKTHINAKLRMVLKESAIPAWWETEDIQQLGGRSPQEMLEAGSGNVLMELVNSYLDPSYG